MKPSAATRIILIILLCLAAAPAHAATAYFFGSVSQTVKAQCVQGDLCPILAIPGATIQVCFPPACATPATTYTDATATTPCPVNAQVLNPGSTACVGTSDGQGNFGFWIVAGTYNYYVTLPPSLGSTVNGPYAISILGSSPASYAPGFQALNIVSNLVAVNLDGGLFGELTLNQATQVQISNPTGLTATLPGSAESQMTIYIIQDSTGSRPTPTWGTAYGSDVSGVFLDGTPNTRSALRLILHSDGLWHLDSFLTGQRLS